MYLIATKRDIVYVVSLISIYMESPKDSHWQARKIILRYVSGTRNHGIFYSRSNEFKLIGHTYSDCARRTDDRKSTFGYVFYFVIGVVSWAQRNNQLSLFHLLKQSM